MESSIKKLSLFFFFFYFSTITLWEKILRINIDYLVCALLVIFIYFYFFKFLFNNEKLNKDFYKIFFLLAIYYIFVIINGIVFKNTARLVVGISEYIMYSIPFFVPTLALYKECDENFIEKLFIVFIIINFATSLLAFYEYISGKYIIGNSAITYADTVNYTIRAVVFNGSYLGLGAFIGQLSLANLYFIFSEKYNKVSYKILFIVSFFVNVLGILATSSRGPLVATFISAVIFYIIYYIFVVLRSDRGNRKVFGFVVILSVVLAIFLVITYLKNYNGEISNTYINANIYKLKTIFDWSNDYSNIERKSYWDYFINIFKENYLYGIGVSSTGARIDSTSIGPTESGVIKRFVELGIFGGILFYSIIVYIFRYCFRYLIKNKNNRNKLLVIITLMASVLAVFIDDITYQVCENQPVMFFYWFILGVIITVLAKDG